MPDTRVALGLMAAEVRRRLPGRVVAITGSVGKTTVKDMTSAALAAFGAVGTTRGNWNNEIGLPLSLFAMDGDEKHVVLELGMSAPGEIAALTEIATPDVGVVTSAVAAHLEFFPSVDAIADAKAELHAGLASTATAVACADDHRVLARALKHHPRSLVTYGLSQEADVRVMDVQQKAEGLETRVDVAGVPVTVNLRALGRHNAVNAAGALASVHALGLPIQEAAEALGAGFKPAAHRLQVLHNPRGLRVVDDCYNANPASTRAALDTLKTLAKPHEARGAVLGSMLELGDDSDRLHREIGSDAARGGLAWLGATGPHAGALAQGATEAGLEEVHTAGDAMELLTPLGEFTHAEDEIRWLLLKGSRGERLERLLEPLGVQEAC